MYDSAKYSPIKTMLAYLAVSETKCINYRPHLHNLKTNRKNLKK